MPESTVTPLNKIPGIFKSRSTVICLACLLTLFAIDALLCTIAWLTGFFTESLVALIFSNSVLLLREIIAQSLGHQLKADQTPGNTPPKVS